MAERMTGQRVPGDHRRRRSAAGGHGRPQRRSKAPPTPHRAAWAPAGAGGGGSGPGGHCWGGLAVAGGSPVAVGLSNDDRGLHRRRGSAGCGGGRPTARLLGPGLLQRSAPKLMQGCRCSVRQFAGSVPLSVQHTVASNPPVLSTHSLAAAQFVASSCGPRRPLARWQYL